MIFQNRVDAGIQLTKRLMHYRHDPKGIVLALPRGGVPVAYEIATRLGLGLDVFLVRKLGAPGQEELAMGAIADNDAIYLNQQIISDLSVSPSDINAAVAREKKELESRKRRYHIEQHPIILKNKNIILVDDGIATGATMHAAILALRKESPHKIILAIPVAPTETIAEMETLVDEIICLHIPTFFSAVGAFYKDFPQTTDEEVKQILQMSKRKNEIH